MRIGDAPAHRYSPPSSSGDCHHPGMATPRTNPAHVGSERDMLGAWLDFHRATLATKCDDLEPRQLIERSVPPSGLTLLGLVRHLAEVEHHWFRRVFLGEAELPDLYCTDDDVDGDFD